MELPLEEAYYMTAVSVFKLCFLDIPVGPCSVNVPYDGAHAYFERHICWVGLAPIDK